MRGEPAQREPGIVGDYERQGRFAGLRIGKAAIHQRRHRTARGHRGEEVVAVETLASQGNKQLAGPDRPAIATHLVEAGLSARFSAHGEGRFEQIHHHARPSCCRSQA